MKQRNTVMMIACLALAAGAAAAADDVARKPPEERWNALDTDGDGALSRAEAEAGAPGMMRNFQKLDANGDGRVTREEMQAARAKRHEQMRERADERWRSADQDGDGAINLAEAQTGMPRAAENFASLDADGDGLLTREEMHQAMRKRHAERGPQ